ncbi:hypothetical protein [Limnohabitans sp. Rim8]|uniref:hypothetical protein n=1 Tax=Limnohabitans sp. Rim8 TaxID=1100718 RepID=UPI0025E0DD34|nr:hypothetical protein [Limnohabitans sp. Rim8]
MKCFGLLALLFCLPVWADHYSPITVWQTVPFIKGQDLCQFQEAYGNTAQESQKKLSLQLVTLLNAGADPSQLIDLINALDRYTHQNRERASAGKGMDVLLEGSLKASLDAQYTKLQPRNRNITFFNPAPIFALARDLREEKRQGYLDASMLGQLNAIAWGSYSYAPSCKGDLVVTLHIQVATGRTYNYQAVGRPEQVMRAISSQLFAEFQHTQFPSKVQMGSRTLELLGAPGVPISHTGSAEAAERTCKSIQARLPTAEEYEFMANLGDWNQGIRTVGRIWALANKMVLAPELPNPSPIRTESEVRAHELYYYCVR